MSNERQSANEAGKQNYLIGLEPDGAAYICVGDSETLALRGDTILGTVAASSEQDAFRQAVEMLPQYVTSPDPRWISTPEIMGITLYRLPD